MKEESEAGSLRHVCTVRRAQPRDYDKMAALAGQLGYQSTGEEIRKRLSHMLDGSQYAVFVAELPGGQIVGWIGAYLFRSVETASYAEINGLVVERTIRSRGIGKLLLNAVEEWARSIGCDAISVRSNAKRNRAHRFYANNGYQLIKTQKEFHRTL
jgi:GNAT superfamily N-acetyltransferase